MSRSLWFALGLLFANVSLGAEPTAQLLIPSRTLEPRSTFELRFAAEMVPPDQLGKPAEPSPLVFDPPIDGRFIWLSTRSGSFAPNGVLPLGTTYKISLRPGLKDVRGKPVNAQLRETAETPPMRVKGSAATSYVDFENATAVPQYTVLFNANVKAADAAKFIRYVNAAGTRVDARVEQVEDPKQRERGFNKWNSDDKSLGVWGEQLQDDPAPGEEEEASDSAADAPGAAPQVKRQNILYIAPAKPLPPGSDWRLVLDVGLPAADSNAKLPAPKEIPIGVVQPFAVKEISAQTNRVEGRRVLVGFTKALAEEVTAENVSQWVKVEPAVPNLKPVINGDDTIELRGEFALGTRYRVTVAPGLPARDLVATATPITQEVAFDKVAPRLYFQDFATHQQTAGTRTLRLIAMNTPRVRVSAKLFKGDDIPAASKAYEAYMNQPADAPADEYFSKVPLESVPGEVIWEKELTNPAAVDKDETMALNWDEIIGPNRSGAVLVTAESIDPVLPPQRVGAQTLVQVTDLGAVWKSDGNGTRFHLFSLATGKGVPGVRLQLLDGENNQLAEAVTDDKGDAQLPKENEGRSVLAQREGDAHLIALSGAGYIPLYQLGVTTENAENENPATTRSVFLFTDRGVYKPGEIVHLKGYAQDPDPERPRVPAGKEVTVKVTDSKDRQISLTTVALSDFGSFNQDIPVPEGALGRFMVEVKGAEGDRLGGIHSFQVQEYKPNAFEVLIPEPPPTVGSTQLDLPVTSKYLMGKPLSKARLTWSLVARDDQFKPEGLAAFAFNNNIWDYRLNRALDKLSRFDAQGEAAVDANGVARVTTPLPVNAKAPQPRATKLLCEVTDINQQTVSESRSWVQHSSEFYFGIRRFDSVMPVGKALPIEVIAVRNDGKPLDAPVNATLRLTRIDWQTNRLDCGRDDGV